VDGALCSRDERDLFQPLFLMGRRIDASAFGNGKQPLAQPTHLSGLLSPKVVVHILPSLPPTGTSSCYGGK